MISFTDRSAAPSASRILRRLGSATALNGSCVVGIRAINQLYTHMGICQGIKKLSGCNFPDSSTLAAVANEGNARLTWWPNRISLCDTYTERAAHPYPLLCNC